MPCRARTSAAAAPLLVAAVAAASLLPACSGEAPRGDAPAPSGPAPAPPGRETTAHNRTPGTTPAGASGGDGVLAPPSGRPVPDVVGMGAKAACRALGREGYSGGVFGEVEASGVQPGRVVEQDPGAGFVGGEGQLVHLFVSAPFRDDLPPSHPCVERRDGS